MSRARRAKRTTHDGPLRAVSYRRVSTREQGDSGLGLAAQASRIAEAVHRKGWEHVGDFQDVGTGKKRNGRHGLEEALSKLSAGEADVLVLAKLDRLCRSLRDFGDIVAQAVSEGWAVKVLDPDIDTSTPSGRMCAGMFALLGEWEAEIISQRTREGLAERRARGHRLGALPEIAPDTEAKVLALYEETGSLSETARRLNADAVPTARGGQWYPSTVSTVLRRSERPQKATKTSGKVEPLSHESEPTTRPWRAAYEALAWTPDGTLPHRKRRHQCMQ